MKSLLRKELREHFKVAILGFVVLSVMLFLGFQSCSNQFLQMTRSYGYSREGLHPLLASAVLTQIAFFCTIFGGLLGWLQVRAESHPDLWAFLVHRPIARSTILGSKIWSGVLLYAAAAGLPLLIYVITVSIPGNIAAPFEWAMALPLVAIFLVGLVYYFAGLLTGLRKARWFASRGFGLGPAILATLAVFTCPEFWQALAVIVVAGGILALAVWGSFQAGGHYREQLLVGKMAVTAVSFVSVLILMGVLLTMSSNFLIDRNDYTYSHYQLIKDGTVLKITQRGYDAAEAVDLTGKPVVDEKTGQPLKLKELQARFASGVSATSDFRTGQSRINRYQSGYQHQGRFFAPWHVLEKTIWYLTADGRLVAYHGLTRRFAGSLRPQGSIADGLPDDSRFKLPFDYEHNQISAYTQPELLSSARATYLVDLEKRELKPLFTVTNGDAIVGYSPGASPFAPMNANFAFILTRTSIQLLDLQGQVHLRVPYQPAPLEYSMVSVYWLDLTNSYAVRLDPDYFANKEAGGKLRSQVKWIESNGSVRNEMDLPKLPEIQRNNLSEKLMLPILPLAFPFYTWEDQYRVWQVLRIVPALLCVLVGWWLGRRNDFSFRSRVGWATFHFLFGLPGLLAFLAVQEWSPKESCPGCGKLRIVRREKCEHCGSEFAPAPKTGTEIFEPLITP